MSLIKKLTKSTSLSPIDKLSSIANKATHGLQQRLDNSVSDFFTNALSKTGLSFPVASQLSSRFGDALQNELADKYFRTNSSVQDRLLTGAAGSIAPSYYETTATAVDRITEKADAAGLESQDIHQYPRQLGKYYMTMKFREYTRTAPQAQATLNFKNAIVLPIPKNLQESFNIKVDSKETGMMGGAADIMQATLAQGNDNYKPIESTVALGYAALTNAANKVESGLGDVVGQYIGNIPNPHLSVFFNGVGMRTHKFDWTFAPRNPEESEDIQRLIKQLKMNSLPAFSQVGTAILQYPYLCMIELQPWESKGEPLIKYKPALLSDVSVNYSPNGIPSFFHGTNLPTFTQLSISMMEVEYFTSDDYGRTAHKDKIGALEDFIKQDETTRGLVETGNEWITSFFGGITN